MGKDACFRNFDVKPAANLPSKVIGRSAHNCIWSRRDPLTPDRRQFEKSVDAPARIGATSQSEPENTDAVAGPFRDAAIRKDAQGARRHVQAARLKLRAPDYCRVFSPWVCAT